MTNRFAEQLRSQLDGWITNGGAHAHAVANLSDALAVEHTLGADEERERIRAALATVRVYEASEARYYMDDDLDAILDAKANQ